MLRRASQSATVSSWSAWRFRSWCQSSPFVKTANHGHDAAPALALPNRNLRSEHGREQQPRAAAAARLPDEDIAAVVGVVLLISEDKLDLALEPLAVRMQKLKGEGVLGVDLAGLVDKHMV